MSRQGSQVVVGSGRISHAELGCVNYTVRSSARRFTARWHGGEVRLSVPPRVSEREFFEALDELTPRLLAAKPSSKYYAGRRIDAGEFSVTIAERSDREPRVQLIRNGSDWTIYTPCGCDYSSPEVERTISQTLRRLARHMAPGILIPQAARLAARIDRHPLGWAISTGQRTLGHCDARGNIALSAALVYMPQELRDLVIYHELAHLSEMNHSAAFHRLLDSYCDGRERELTARLKAFKLPL